ncbi:MAG: ABC transporter ATP-binding protein, partial [Stellaceae bacterium]
MSTGLAQSNTREGAAAADGTAGRFLELESISKTYAARDGRPVRALDRISCAIGSGEFVSILGPSGCGKSTLLLIIAGLLPASGGAVRFHGTANGKALDFGIVFQDPVLLPWRTVFDNVMLPVEVLGLDRKSSAKRGMDLLGLVGLRGFEEKYPHELSGGMRQRVAIARALVHDPSLLLM